MFYIVVPSFNSETFINECLNSIVSQTLEDFQIIFVDDGSTDSSLKLVKGLKDSRIIVLEKENGGPSSARNYALDYIFNNCTTVKDSYICFVDSDDLISSRFLEEHYKILKSNNADIVCSQSTSNPKCFVDESGECDCCDKCEALYKLFTNKIFSFSCIKLYKLELWSNIRFPNQCTNSEDVATIYKIFYKTNKVVQCGLRQYFYRDNPMSIIRRKQTNDSLISMQTAYYLRLKETSEKFIELENFDILKYECTLSFCNVVLNTTRHLSIKELNDVQIKSLKMILTYFDEVYSKSYFSFTFKGLVKQILYRIKKKKITNKNRF